MISQAIFYALLCDVRSRFGVRLSERTRCVSEAKSFSPNGVETAATQPLCRPFAGDLFPSIAHFCRKISSTSLASPLLCRVPIFRGPSSVVRNSTTLSDPAPAPQLLEKGRSTSSWTPCLSSLGISVVT